MTWTSPEAVRSWSAPLGRDAEEVLRVATSTLAAVGFAVVPVPDGLDATGPQRRGSKESPVLALGRLELRVNGGTCTGRTDLSGGALLERFVRWFPTALSLALALFFGGLGAVGWLGADLAFGVGAWGAAGLGFALPAALIAAIWLPLGAWMGRRLRRDHEAAVRSLLATVAGCPLDQVREG